MAGKKGMHDKHRFNTEYMDRLRAKINTSKLVAALQKHVVSGSEMSSSQVNAALGLLRKVLPELASSEIKATVESFSDDLKLISERKSRNAAQQLPVLAAPEQTAPDTIQ